MQLLGATLVVAAPELQAPRGLELRWEASEGCPTADEARERVESFLGRPAGQAGDPNVQARVRITEHDGLFVAELELRGEDGDGHRTLEADRCDVVADAAAYVVAAMIDPTVELVLPEPEPEPPPLEAASESRTTPEPTPAPDRAAPAPPDPVQAPADRPRARSRGALRAGPALAAGPLPSLAAGIVAGAAWLRPRVRLELLATHWFARPTEPIAGPDVGGDIRLTTAGVRVCPLVVQRPIEVPVCGGLELGSMFGRGVGLTEPSSVRLLWAAVTASAGLVWMPSRRVGPWIDAALTIPVSRPVFVIESLGPAHQPARAAFYGQLGVELRFF